MAGNRDLIEILREIRGSGVPGELYTNGIWYELTIADIDGTPGIYGDILAKYGIIIDNVAGIELIAEIQTQIQAIYDIRVDVSTVSSNIAILQGIITNITTLIEVHANLANINDLNTTPMREAILDVSSNPVRQSVLDAEGNALVASNKATEAANSADSALAHMEDANTYRGQALTSKTDAQLSAWEAEAERMTADSYATEPHNLFVKTYTSNGDGTFTTTITTESSALHWAVEANDIVTGGIIDDEVTSQITVYSSEKVMELHASQAQAIANLSTAQAQISNDDSTVITTSNQMLSFLTVIDSTDTNIVTLDDIANTITFKSNASYNFSSVINLASSTSSGRTITFEVINVADNSVLTTQSAELDVPSGSDIVINTVTLLTIGRGLFPSAPITASIRVRASGTGYTVTSFTSVLASSSSYDVTTEASGISFVPSGTIAAVNVQDAIEEIDTQLGSVNLFRADKYLASQNIVNMVYSSGNLTKIQYNNPIDVDYEVLSYNSGSLVGVAHLIGNVLKGNTVLTYSNGTLISSVFTGV